MSNMWKWDMKIEMVQDETRQTLLLVDSNVINRGNKKKKMDYIYKTTSSSSDEGDEYALSADSSPLMMSPWKQGSPLPKFPWPSSSNIRQPTALVGSLRRKEGHIIYSLAAKDGLLYTGSDSKNIHAWRNMQEFDAFKSSSGFVKAIVISGDRIFSGHQDGRIRVWKIDGGGLHRQIGTLPTFFAVLKASMRPNNYVQVKSNRKALWIKHADAVSCLSMSEENGLLYSASWDRTFKVWLLSNSKCIESVAAHDDALNAIVVGTAGLVYTGSADGTVRVWRRERDGKAVRHLLWRTLLRQDCAVTALAVGDKGCVVYCGSSDGLVNFWEVEEKHLLSHGGVLRGHQLAVLCLAAPGNLVLSGSADKTISVWRREGLEHTCLTVLSGHTGPVKCLAVEADGDGGDRKWKVYSGSLDNSVKVWSVSETTQAQNRSWTWRFD